MNKFSMIAPLTGEYFTTIRLATGGLCALAGFDVEQAEDFKVCVTESLLILKRNGFTSAKITMENGEALSCQIEGEEQGGEVVETLEDEISHALLSALLGTVEFVKDSDKVVKIKFEG
ncbi:MAG: hypothetical protein J6K86_01475 [Clostridia bacterium]|nr:hypothetical protein [Clostridia bacterium]MBP3422416.1 hypothetical protein [Clostridia bacterium]